MEIKFSSETLTGNIDRDVVSSADLNEWSGTHIDSTLGALNIKGEDLPRGIHLERKFTIELKSRNVHSDI